MSIQDESFPNDVNSEFFCDSGKNFLFPNHRRHDSKKTNEEKRGIPVKMNISFPTSQNQDDSTQSFNDFYLSSETSGKTNASEPNFRESANKKSEFRPHNSNKSISYQDIHSEYTKKRYKHVESKVGQYIANMKAQDEERRNSGKFHRYRSMPETLHEKETTAIELNNSSKQLGLLRCNIYELDRVQNNIQCDQSTDNGDNLKIAASSLSPKDLASENYILVDKHIYEQLLSVTERNDYLQSKLEEKNLDNCRLKQNLDTIRIEYTLCKDKLKQQQQRFSGSYGSINLAASFGRTSLQNFLYSQETREQSTQTDKVLTTESAMLAQNGMFATPLTPDSNNNSHDYAAIAMMAPGGHKVPKSIATIQPISLNFSNLVEQDLNNSNINTTISFLRKRSNSVAIRKKSAPLTANISKTSSAESGVPSNSDSTIEYEATESPHTQRNREEFIYYEQSSQCCAVVETCNDMNIINNNTVESVMGSDIKRNRRKRHNLRSRMLRFFGVCTKCDDPTISLETIDSQHSQIPLLEKRTPNYCSNKR